MDTHKNKDFDALLRHKFDDYEVELPKNDWEVFSRKLAAKQPKRRAFVWYYGAAAASIIGLLFLGISFLTVHEKAPKLAQNSSLGNNTNITTTQKAPVAATEKNNKAGQISKPTLFASASVGRGSSAVPNKESKNSRETVQSQTAVVIAKTSTIKPTDANPLVEMSNDNVLPLQKNTQVIAATVQPTADTTGYITHPVTQYAELPPMPAIADEKGDKRSKKSSGANGVKWLAGNFQGNLGISSGNNSDLASSGLSSQLYSRVSKAAALEASSTPTLISFTSNKTYYLPLTFGLSTGIRIAPRWELQSGITYTLLITSGDVGYSTVRSTGRIEQHYLGIPASLAYSFIQKPSFSVYVSGGGRIEKGVSLVEKIYTYNSQNDPIEQVRYKYAINGIQLTLDAGVGASYRLYRFINWYLEVGGAWYIPGNQPESSRTIHPLNVALKTGLRFSLYK